MNTSEALNRMAAITSAQSVVAAYNNDIDKYVNGDLLYEYSAAGIRVYDGRISVSDVLRAATIYNDKVLDAFWHRAMDILFYMKDHDFDVRMDMSNYKLVWKGVI